MAEIVSAVDLERARCLKLGVPYDPVDSKIQRGIAQWKRENHAAMEQAADLKRRTRKSRAS